MKKCKHRLFIDIEVSEPMTRKDAAEGFYNVLAYLDLDAHAMWHYTLAPYVNKVTIVEPR